MHRCLSLTEIVDLVSQYVAGDPHRKSNWDPKSTSALALTCKAFRDPASAMLWERLDKLTHLLKTLPQNLWKGEKRQGGRGIAQKDIMSKCNAP
jgi:hypothetical protein